MTDVEQGGQSSLPEERALPSTKAEFVQTNIDTGLTALEVEKALEKYGPNEIPVPKTPLYKIFVRQFQGFLPFLIEVAALVSLAVGDFVDFAIIFGILFVNALLGFREEYHAKKALDELGSSLESEITVIRDGTASFIPTKDLVPGDIVLLVGGSGVPADLKWLRGDVMQVDTAPLTGEPLPRKYPSSDYGDVVLSGSTIMSGESYCQVLTTGTNTEIGQSQADILKDKMVRVISVFQTKIMTVVQILVTSCLAIVLAVLLVEGIAYNGFSHSVKSTILDALSIMIASIPVALPLVLQVNLALGASFLAKEHNAIVTSIPALQDIASMSMLCSDKTGTLTTAKMSVIPEQVHPVDDFSEEDVVMYAYLSSNPDKKDDPIDRAIVAAFDKLSMGKKEEAQKFEQVEIIGFNPVVKRVVAFVKKEDKIITIAKGLPAKILNTAAGGEDDHELQWKVDRYNSRSFLTSINNTDERLSKAGYKTIGIAICDGDARQLEHPVWKFVGLCPLLDPAREDTAATIASLHHANISVKMITGDHVNVAKETARMIGMGTDIRSGEEIRSAGPEEKQQLIWNADGFATVLPSDKREVVLILRSQGIVTGFTGDGPNDAAALSAAQVGIAVAGATDAAKNAADLILTEAGLSPIYGAVLESRRIFARIKSYVVYRVAASIILVLTLSILLFVSGCAVDSLLIIILALINDISMIPVAYDNASATTKPQLPDAKKLVLQSIFYGACHSAASLIFILSLNQSGSLDVDLNSNCTSETRGFIWFYLVLVTELAIFSVRAPTYFWLSLPSPILAASVLTTCIGSAMIAVYASNLAWTNVGYIAAYNAGVFVLIDFFKVSFRRLIKDDPGDVIESDELLEVDTKKSDATKEMEKQKRYRVHQDSLLPPDSIGYTVEFRDRRASGIMDFIGDMRPVTFADDFVGGRGMRSKAFSVPVGGVSPMQRVKASSTSSAQAGFFSP